LPRHPARTVVGPLLVAALALWCSRSALDVAGTADAQLRVAVLASWPELAAAVVLLFLGAAAISLALLPAGGSTVGRPLTWHPLVADAVRPLLALAVLLLPYLPWLPDWIPALRVLAGPIKWLLWLVVLGQVAWNVLPHLAGRWWPTAGRALRRTTAAALIFVVSLCASVFTWHQLDGLRLPGGDEPHYLVIAQSLLSDGDLRIANNHERGDYLEYYSLPLKPDYRTTGADGEIYSIHPIGLAYVIAPVFAVAGYPGVVWLLMLLSAATATLFWRWARALTDSTAAATFAWAAVALSTTWVFNSVTVYQEIPGAFCVMLALGLLGPAPSPTRPDRPTRQGLPPRLVMAALAIAALPWLHTKYAGMALVLAAALAWRHRRPPQVALILGPLALSLAGWFTFFYRVWGTPLPSAPYGADPQMNPLTLLRGAPGIWFDQEFGIVTYAPVLLVAFLGLAAMARERSTRLFAAELTLVGLALMTAVGSFDLWWGGSSMPGRGMIAMLPVLAAPIAWYYHRAFAHVGRRTAMQALLLVSLTITLTMAVAAGGRLAGQNRDGTSPLLEWLSPAWDLWASAPTFIFSPPMTSWAQTALWLTGTALVAWLCRRSPFATPGRAARKAVSVAVVVYVAVASLTPSIPGASPPRFDPEARIYFPLLVDFDAEARPVGLRYDPLSIVAPSTIPPLFTLSAAPGQRVVPQARPVLLNARFALPAGEYEVEVTAAPGPGALSGASLSLQVGREGGPLVTWPVAPGSDGVWLQRFVLPIDAEFVGFVAVPDVEAAVAKLRLRPVTILDAGRRFSTPSVLSAGAWGPIEIFFHDSRPYVEPGGFWVRGWSSLRGTVIADLGGSGELTLRVHGGPSANTATFETQYWSEVVDLEPGVARTIAVPASPAAGFVPLRITSAAGFVPAEVEPDSTDPRRLGIWIEFAR